MQRLAAVIVAFVALALCGTAAASSVFVIRGHGWGHGVGMAQWGAYGFAKHGKSYDEILAHYYPGTELGKASIARIRVLLAQGRGTVEVGSAAPFRVVDGTGSVLELPAGTATVRGDLTVVADGTERKLQGPLRFKPGAKPLSFGTLYRGHLIVRAEAGGLSVVNQLGLERYLAGVLPGEMSPAWPAEALKAQAVAARSYALASRKRSGSFDVYADTRSQVYGGIAVEDDRATAAIVATKGEVVTWEGEVAWTFFSASSGGRTAAIEDVWDSPPIPYLVSVDDPYDALSPHHNWGPITFTAAELEERLGSRAPDGLTELRVTVNGSGRVDSVTLVGKGGTSEISGATMRTLLGLKSTWFRIDTLSLDASNAKIVYGQDVVLTGSAKGAKRAVVERRAAGGAWKRLAEVRPGRTGSFRTSDSPTVSSDYRIRALGLVGPSVRVSVAPRVTIRLDPSGQGLIGDVTPRVAGMEVAIQRRFGSRWETIGSPKLEAEGAFRAHLSLEPGVYRAVTTPAAGLVRGSSKPLRVA